MPHIEGSVREAFSGQIVQRDASEKKMDKRYTSENEKNIGKWGASVESD